MKRHGEWGGAPASLGSSPYLDADLAHRSHTSHVRRDFGPWNSQETASHARGMSRPFESEPAFLLSLAAPTEAEIRGWLHRAATALERLALLPVQGGCDAQRLDAASQAVHLAIVELEPFS